MSKTKVNFKRHLLKTITWRIIGTIDTVVIGWVVSGDPLIGLTIAGVNYCLMSIFVTFRAHKLIAIN